MSCSRHPTVKWAQRSDKVYITVELPDAEDVKLKLEPQGKFFFSATGGASKTKYEVDLDLFDSVDVNESKASVSSRSVCYLVKKAESKWWNRLIKQEGKPPVYLKVDWDKWVDEDEDDKDMDFGDFDFSGLNMGDSDEIGDEEEDSELEGETVAETKETKDIVEEGNGEKDEEVDVKKD
ncbi:co-chaperone protein p23-1 isoform X1 [Raphanus sativus]|uniref:Co-chaperone protein p23 n=1 Tax=Raphanus sativus TaxID=3726 RepID=A0A6J0JGD8_RAPSA|nr:co-chaperone protein p23-1 isoform X1 [Raphanus sativus]